MDIRCPLCAEPFAIDALHERATAEQRPFASVRDDFYRVVIMAYGR